MVAVLTVAGNVIPTFSVRALAAGIVVNGAVFEFTRAKLGHSLDFICGRVVFITRFLFLDYLSWWQLVL